MTGADPRTGLRPNLDLLSAYALYEKGIDLPMPNIAATLAMNSPLYKRIEETLTEQTRSIAEHLGDQATTRRIATESGVNMAALGQMLTALQPPPPPAPPAATLQRVDDQMRAAEDARLTAVRQGCRWPQE